MSVAVRFVNLQPSVSLGDKSLMAGLCSQQSRCRFRSAEKSLDAARSGAVISSSVGLGTRHCEERSDEAIHCHRCSGCGLLRGACHRARIRATRWLAMTVSVASLLAMTTNIG